MQERLLPPQSRLAQARADLGLSLSAHFEPSSELGGDFWDLRRDDRDRLIVWLVDFSGHGVGAALNTFRLHAILRQMDLSNFDPAEHLREVNERVCPLLRNGQFATMLVGVVDQATDTFHYASAGAPAPMMWQPGDEAPEFGDSSGLPVGILHQPATRTATFPCRSVAACSSTAMAPANSGPATIPCWGKKVCWRSSRDRCTSWTTTASWMVC